MVFKEIKKEDFDNSALVEVQFEDVMKYLLMRYANEIWLKYRGENTVAAKDVLQGLQDLSDKELFDRIFGRSKVEIFDGEQDGYYFNVFTGVKTKEETLYVYRHKCYCSTDGELNGEVANFKLFDNAVNIEQIAKDAKTMDFGVYKQKYNFNFENV